ncbi:LolA family protein [Sneathiella aquimaris]|uniref:LolA family protein n=1 Tax=Sneathiella aquimaris TaxID=2599305 RepID=UPI00146B8FF0|nr:outer membrane lipoprotein carrier protein LolA [Sneathiella aquimaris]
MQKMIHLFILMAITTISFVVTPAMAATLTTSEKEDVARVEDYLNGISTLKARFLQVNSAGQIAEGDVYMRRPGRMRFEYEPPAQILVVADGTWLILHDKELKETNRLPLSSTPVSVLLNEGAKLSGNVTVVSVEKDGGTLRLNIIDTNEPDEGGITLVFEDRPLKLRKWLVTDAQGNTTSVSLSNMEWGIPLKPELFNFSDYDYD